jgi:hypothetical protein
MAEMTTDMTYKVVLAILREDGYSDEEIEKRLEKTNAILLEEFKDLLSVWFLKSIPIDKNKA